MYIIDVLFINNLLINLFTGYVENSLKNKEKIFEKMTHAVQMNSHKNWHRIACNSEFIVFALNI